jgi:hypothetical protein
VRGQRASLDGKGALLQRAAYIHDEQVDLMHLSHC